MHVGEVDDPVGGLAVAEADLPGLEPFRLQPLASAATRTGADSKAANQKSAAIESMHSDLSLMRFAHGLFQRREQGRGVRQMGDGTAAFTKPKPAP